MRPEGPALAAALSLGVASAACAGAIGDGDQPPVRSPRPTPPAAAGRCGEAPEVPASPLARLSAVEYRNTLRDVLAMAGVPAVLAEVEDSLATVPEDRHELFAALDGDVTPSHVEAYHRVAVDVAEAIASRPERLARVTGTCAAKLHASCLEAFMGGFARYAYRRPLADDEKEALRGFDDGQSTPAEAVRAMIVALLTSPRFLNHLEVDGAPAHREPAVLLLSPYEVASRLSYAFWRSMPDEALLQAAAADTLRTPEGLAREVDRVFEHARTRETLVAFWAEWVRADALATIRLPDGDRAFDLFARGESINQPGHDHVGAMIAEVRELTEHVAFAKGGTFADLLTTSVSVTRSPDLARLYGTTPWSGAGEPPVIAAGARPGLFTRAALLVTNGPRTNPFHRGALYRGRLLCLPTAQPAPAALPQGALDPPAVEAGKTTRQRFEAKMSEGCLGCHARFNGIGYVLEAYDALGRYRTAERLFDDDGAYLGELPIDPRAVVNVGGAAREVSGPAELIAEMAAAGRAEGCFARSFVTFALRRPAAPAEGGACGADRPAGGPGAPLTAVYKRLALEPSFLRRRVGAP